MMTIYIVRPLANSSHLGFFTHNDMSKISHRYVRHTWKPYDGHQKHESASIMSKMILIYCLSLNKSRPSWIFYPHCNVENIFWQHHYVRHTWKPHDGHQRDESASIMSKMILIYCLSLNKWRPSWIFHPQCNVWIIFWQHHYVRHTWKPHDGHQREESASIMSKMIWIYYLTLNK